MKINSINGYYNKFQHNQKFKSNIHFNNRKEDTANKESSFAFCESFYHTVPPLIRKKFIPLKNQDPLKPIKTYGEYRKLLNEVLNYIEPNYFFDREKNSSLFGYENAPENLLGLVSYCGQADKSEQINKWLSGRSIQKQSFTEEQMANVIRVLEYSLKELDKKFGKYNGVVYRVGFFNPNSDSQFYSSSSVPACTIRHGLWRTPSNSANYSIIKVKNGHYIYKFQKSVNSYISNRFEMIEKEILLDRKSKFRLIPEDKYSKEDTDLIINFIAMSLGASYISARQMFDNEKNSEMIKNISIWEEV